MILTCKDWIFLQKSDVKALQDGQMVVKHKLLWIPVENFSLKLQINVIGDEVTSF